MSAPWETGRLNSGISRPSELEAETLGLSGYRSERRFADRVGVERPEEDADVLDVVAAALDGDAANVDGVGGLVEPGVHVFGGLPLAQV